MADPFQDVDARGADFIKAMALGADAVAVSHRHAASTTRRVWRCKTRDSGRRALLVIKSAFPAFGRVAHRARLSP